MKYCDLIDLVQEKAVKKPNKIIYTFLNFDGNRKNEVNLTYGDVYDKARKVAVMLKKKGMKKADRVIIFSSETENNIYSVYGSLFAGTVFTIIPPPIDEGKKIRFQSVLKSSHAKLILCSNEILKKVEQTEYKDILNGIEIIDPDKCNENPEEWTKGNICENDVAYLQYSSGSTNDPKGVIISHKNVINNVDSIDRYFKKDKSDTVVSWIPFFHNMGLIGIVFLNVYSERRNIIMTPQSFLQNPMRWFKVITDYKADISVAPNSAYNLCTRIINDNQMKDIDLSSLRFLLNGSEVINAKDITQFTDKFKKCGLNPAVICPSYGLAESTCGVAMKSFNPIVQTIDYRDFQKNIFSIIDKNDDIPKKEIVSVGEPLNNVEIKIINPYTNKIAGKNEIGEVCIKSNSIGLGYLDKKEISEKIFRLKIDNEDGSFLRTGDLGFVYEGQLYITGRIKEMMIINGHNIYSQDIEVNLKENIPELNNLDIVAFTITVKNQEKLVLCIECNSNNFNFKQLTDNINKVIYKIFELSPYDIVFIKQGTLSRTDNGKIALFKVKKLYEENKLKCLYDIKLINAEKKELQESDEVQNIIMELFKEILNVESINLDDNFLELGGNSFDTVELVFKLEEKFNLKLELKDIIMKPTVNGIYNYLVSKRNRDEVKEIDKINLYDECYLSEDIYPESAIKPSYKIPKNIFLTGTTGFVGAHLIKSLIEKLNPKIYCHVRAENIETGFERIKNNMMHYECWNNRYRENIVPVLGDLKEPLLGINEEYFDELSEKIDTIYHNGALLNFMFPYNHLKAPNVLGTIECLRLACKKKPKHFNYISTFSVYDNPSHFKTIAYEDDELKSADGYFLGYSETKWVSEKLVRIAEKRGLDVTIYRPGDITGAFDTGIWDVGDMVSRFIVACIQMNAAPDMLINIFYTPVDFISEAITNISIDKASRGKAFNLINLNIISPKELADMIREYGYDIQVIPYKKWKNMLFNSDSDTNSLKILECLFMNDEEEETSLVRRYSDQQAKFDITNTLNILKNKGVVCPPVDKRIIFSYLDYFVKKGYIREPNAVCEAAVTK